jgi:penicillin V acylase-like amidase (Ntn superfamily)
VTFNQFGRELPFGGMNEAGLVVEDMWLGNTVYPVPDQRPEINMLQWIQYQLDTCRTVAEVISNDAKIRLEPPNLPAWVHYLVTDATGDTATIEFLNGKMVCHRGKDLPFRALANDTYDESLAFARAHPATAGMGDKIANTASLSRFAFAAARAAGFKAGTAKQDLDYAFDTLQQVCQGNYTVWRIVYDVSNRQIHFRTQENPEPRVLDLKTMDFSCGQPVKFADIQSKPSATGALEFQELTEPLHRKYLEGFYSQASLKQLLGDLGPRIDGVLLTLRTYTCAP